MWSIRRRWLKNKKAESNFVDENENFNAAAWRIQGVEGYG